MKIKQFIALLILLYLPLAWFWPEILLKNYLFLPLAILAFLLFFFDLTNKEKIALIAASVVVGLFLANILPDPFILFRKIGIVLPISLGLGLLVIFLVIFIVVKLSFLVYNKLSIGIKK